MAVHTAVAFIILGVAASFINSDLGVTGIFTGRMLGHLMAKRLFFPMLAGILLAGYLRILSHRYDIVSVEFGIALLVITFIIITLILIWIVSSLLNKSSIKIQRAKDHLNMVVEAAPFALVLTDCYGNVIEINKNAETLFGYSKEELEGKNVSLLVPDEFRKEWMDKRNSFFATPEVAEYGFNDEICSIKKNGTKFPIEIILTPIQTDEETRILSFVIDITTRKSNETIINQQLIELQSKNRELEQFNYISSHDLQEPLRTVLNYIQLLEEDYPELSDEIKVHLKTMESSVTRMSTVVRSLLDFGRLGRNKKLVLTDCKKILNEVITDLNTIVKNSGAVITLGEGHPMVYAYETEMRQLFQNLINNAIKFRKPDTVPHIDISCRDIGGYYEFTVSDNGIGIPPKYFEKIFDIFQRLNKECEFEGHGGKIWVESVPGEWSTFKFTILNIKP
jgi:PAS domain S-box-containing protein